MKKIKRFQTEPFYFKLKLVSFGSSYRTNACARTAIDTFVSVYHIFVITCRNTGNRTFAFTCSAADAAVVNDVCHFIYTSLYA